MYSLLLLLKRMHQLPENMLHMLSSSMISKVSVLDAAGTYYIDVWKALIKITIFTTFNILISVSSSFLLRENPTGYSKECQVKKIYVEKLVGTPLYCFWKINAQSFLFLFLQCLNLYCCLFLLWQVHRLPKNIL